MKKYILLLVILTAVFAAPMVRATQADDTTITITGQNAGPTPFISQITLSADDTTVIKSIQFTITPKPSSVVRPLSTNYSNAYLVERGDLMPDGQIFIPVYGLFAGYTNTVTLTYYFLDGSSKEDSTTVTTPAFDDEGCGYNTPTKLVPRSDSTVLSYDYIFDRSGCGDYSPVILDTDGNLRWVSTLPTMGALFAASTFYNNAVYTTQSTIVYKIDMDGTVNTVSDYRPIGVSGFHHNIDAGKVGILLEPDTTSYYESTILEVDADTGDVLKTFDMASIISAAMIAGGDDPSQFVYPNPTDWFHNNGAIYNRADDSVIISSRENFVICLDYETEAIKWILGDKSKKWYTFPSLAKYAFDFAGGSLAPIGQHAPSLTFDNDLMVFDNGQNSLFQVPSGVNREYASPRKYSLDFTNNLATEVWNYPMDETIHNPFCGSVYEDSPYHYLIDYAFVNGGLPNVPTYAQLLGLDPAENQVFYYQYPTVGCNTAYNSLPIHLESSSFPVISAKALNLSTRGLVSNGGDTLIAGFIVSGTDPKNVALRVLGPSLGSAGLSGTVADPNLTLYDSAGNVVATNDNWASDPNASELTANGLAPTNAKEAATVQTLNPGSYTVVAGSVDGSTGLGLIEAYDLAPESSSELANVSTRGSVGTGDNVLISGVIVGQIDPATVILRALGPSLASAGLTGTLSDPYLTVYDQNGATIATNDNWQDNLTSTDIQKNGLAPSDPAESALLLNLPPGLYTASVTGVGGTTGIGLLEVYNLDNGD